MPLSAMPLADKVVLVTGAARRVGAVIAAAFHAEGARVAVHYRSSRAEAEALVKRLEALRPGSARAFAADLADTAACGLLPESVVRGFGRLDVLVNNAGITQPRKTADITAADYDAVLDVSLRGTLYMSQAVLPAMRAARSGSIVCISSVSAQRGGGILGGPHYSAAKAGVLGLARAMAREFGNDNIRINCITPGLIGTDINKGLIPDDRMKGILEQIPLNRIGSPDDVAGCVVFLASDLAKYCTGVTLDCNGGMLIH